MKVGVLGTGVVGRTIARKLEELGHEVSIGTRDVDALVARTEPDAMGNEPFASWTTANPQVSVGTFADAAAHGEMLVNATNGASSIDALEAAGLQNLDGKILVDVSNPLDSSQGMPPTLFVSNTDSLGERIQRAFPSVKVVKALNTVTAAVMVDPSAVAGGRHTIFVSGNDDGAKAKVSELLRSIGWADVLDLGDITTARGAEMYLPLWLRLWGALGSPMFNVSIAR